MCRARRRQRRCDLATESDAGHSACQRPNRTLPPNGAGSAVSDYPALEDRAGPDVSLHIGSRSRQHPHSTAHRRASSRSREPAPDSNRPTTAAGGGSYAAPQATSMVAGVVATFLHVSRAAVDAATNHLAPRKDRHLGEAEFRIPATHSPRQSLIQNRVSQEVVTVNTERHASVSAAHSQSPTSRISIPICSCGQDLDVCLGRHCPRCGMLLKRPSNLATVGLPVGLSSRG